MADQKQNPGMLDQLIQFLMGPKTALDKAAAQGAPMQPQMTPAQDDSGLRKAVADSMARKKERDDMALSKAAAEALAMPKKKKKIVGAPYPLTPKM